MIARTLAMLVLICIAASLASSAPAADQVSNSIAQLSGINKYDRRAAMESLGASKDVRAIQPLITRLGVQDDGKYAAKALVAIGAPAVDPLIKLLTSKAPLVRANAVRALGMLKNAKAVKPLLSVLQDPEPEVRVQVIRALAFSKDPAVTAKMLTIYNDPEAEYEVQQAACDTIVRIGDPKAIDKLIARLEDGGETGPVIAALAQLTEPRAVRAVVASVASEDSPQMLSRVWSNADRSIVPSLIGLLKDPDVKIRRGAIWGLRGILDHIKDIDALQALAEALKDGERETRLTAVEALEAFGGDSATDLLIGALDDPDASVRYRTVCGLQQIKSPRAVLPLCAKLADPDRQVRISVTYALLELSDPRSADALLRAIGDSDPSVRHGAYLALASTRDARALEILLNALRDEDAPTRLAAASGLGRLADKAAVEPLIAALKDPDPGVQRAAAVSLGSIGDKRALEPLLELLRTSKKEARFEIADAIGLLGDSRAAKPLLDIALADPQECVGILMTLAELHHTSAVEPIIALLDNKKLDEQTRGNILWVLGKFKDRRATPALLAALKQNEFEYSQEVIESLIRIRDPRAFDALAGVIRNPKSFWRWNAAYALSLIDDPRVDAFLMPYADRGDMEVIAGADQFFIKHGVEKAIPALIDALESGAAGADMAEEFIASGRPELVEAARNWRPDEYSQNVMDEEHDPYAKWGEARK